MKYERRNLTSKKLLKRKGSDIWELFGLSDGNPYSLE